MRLSGLRKSARVLRYIIRDHGGGRFQLSPTEAAAYEQQSQNLALASAARFGIGDDELLALIHFLAETWSNWHRDGRPLIAEAYKAVLEKAIILTRHTEGMSFAQLRERIGKIGGWFKPIFDLIWPDWAEEEKERVRLTLKGATRSSKLNTIAVTDSDIEAFVNFLAAGGLEAFFWRLKSFEDHALRGNEFAREGMRSDIQGMAIAVEHVTVSLGGTETQLYEKFKQLWRNPDVLQILKRGDVAPLARKADLANDWSSLKTRIKALANEPSGQIAADLVMAHRIRGGVHTSLPEDDHFELEALFIGLMRAALLTFIETQSNLPEAKHPA
ncbi:hypothetical protein RHE_CH02000 [Rhizobium etli CFN 42]|uniref:Uncharacterized protein n=1 Tax=Rhizobium etli (strain ATCC 51251 / DSM 11541 / JCM 21823 / NBRC 15573 / CFN 42) TaxID=347834 RepID=Q2K8Q1_RHIEC|nr:hypothetical protein RHE_CH02000 [Rhizobium etli CFN 42]